MGSIYLGLLRSPLRLSHTVMINISITVLNVSINYDHADSSLWELRCSCALKSMTNSVYSSRPTQSECKPSEAVPYRKTYGYSHWAEVWKQSCTTKGSVSVREHSSNWCILQQYKYCDRQHLCRLATQASSCYPRPICHLLSVVLWYPGQVTPPLVTGV